MVTTTHENIIKKFESSTLQNNDYYSSWDVLFKLEELEKFLLEIAYSELNIKCDTLIEFKHEVNSIAYKHNIAQKALFPELHCLNSKLSELHVVIQKLKQGLYGERKADNVLATLPSPYIIIENVDLEFYSLRSECDRIVITPKGVFIIEVKNNKQDMILKENGDYAPLDADIPYTIRNVGDSMTLRKDLLWEILNERFGRFFSTNLPIETLLLFVNDDVNLVDDYHKLHICSCNGLNDYIANYPSRLDMNYEQMNLVASAIEDSIGIHSTSIPVNVTQIIHHFSEVVARLGSLENVIPFDKQRFISEFTESFTKIMTQELRTKGLLNEMVIPTSESPKQKKKVLRCKATKEQQLAFKQHMAEINCTKEHQNINQQTTEAVSDISRKQDNTCNKNCIDLACAASILLGIAGSLLAVGIGASHNSARR